MANGKDAWRFATDYPLRPSEVPSFHYELVLMSDWKTRLPNFFADDLPEPSQDEPLTDDST